MLLRQLSYAIKSQLNTPKAQILEIFVTQDVRHHHYCAVFLDVSVLEHALRQSGFSGIQTPYTESNNNMLLTIQ